MSSSTPTVLWDKLQQQGYQHAYIDGGATIQAFAACHLIQDWIITRVPVLLGDGIPLFVTATSVPAQGQSSSTSSLTHVHTKVSSTGLVTSHYRAKPIP